MPDYPTIIASGLLSLIVSLSTIEYRFHREKELQANTNLYEWYDRAEDLVKQVEYAFNYSLNSERNSLNRAHEELDPVIKALYVHGHTAPESVQSPLIQKMDRLATLCDEIVRLTESEFNYREVDPEYAIELLIDWGIMAENFDHSSISSEEDWDDAREDMIHHKMDENLGFIEEVLIEIRNHRRNLE